MSAASPVVLFLLICSTTSALDSYITLSSSLKPFMNPVWRSYSRIFAFGFYHTPDGFAICISSYDRSRTVVWTANTENPIVPHDVFLLLTKDGLLLKKSDSKETVARIDNSSQPISGASMLDNGNFVLYDSHGSVSWQTFDHPTDSLLPGQRLLPGAELLSRASETDLETGIFRLKMQNDGNLVLYSVDSLDVPDDSYYAFGTNGRGFNISLNLESDGHLFLFDGGSVLMNITMGMDTGRETLYLVRLDIDGILRLYSRSLEQEDFWITIWSVTEDKCLPKGLCGINSYCIYKDKEVECRCLPGYYSVRQDVWSSGCTSNLEVNCWDKDQSSRFEMRRVENVTWEDNYYSVSDGTSEKHCEEACLKDCSCHVALFSNGQCRKQQLPLRYGKWLEGNEDVAFVRVTNSSLGNPWFSRHKLRNPGLHVMLVVTFGLTALVIASIILIYYRRRQCGWCNEGNEHKHNIDKVLLKHGSLAPKRYSCKEIKKITKSCTDKLGQGGYGIVYKGKLADGQLVAVKVLNERHDNAEEFINEVASISRTSHVNIVNLLGFCYHRNKRALVYEFMPNKSLDKFVCKSRSVDPKCSLEWKKLYEIAVGVARGLEYLHRGCNTRIVHFDIKPQNILLDEDFNPKISDFGLAKLCMKKQSVISMLGTRGTIGYIAPEVFSRNFGVVSHKSDVYSYGIMLLHMVEAKYVEMELFSLSENDFLDKVYEHVLVHNGRVDDLMTEEDEESARKMLMVGFWCIQTSPMDRPSMSKVVEMLEGKLQSIQTPPMPFLLSSPKPQASSFVSCNCICKKLGKADMDSNPRPSHLFI